MNKTLTYILLMVMVTVLTACYQEENDIFSTAQITVSAESGMTITRVQAQALLTNVNTRQTTTSADFNGATLSIELLRGAYEISIEGVVTYHDAQGQEYIRQFRAQTDYVELVKEGLNTASLPIIFLD